MNTPAEHTHRKRVLSRHALLSLLFSVCLTVTGAAGAVAAEATTSSFTDTGGRYWTWSLTQPAATNPLTDTTGEFCGQGQSGDTWFLAGTLSSKRVTRTCTIPTGKKVVFPVVNSAYFAFAADPPEQRTEEFVRSQVAFVKDQATGMQVRIDGQSLPTARIQYEESRLFAITLPADNLFGLPAGFRLDPSVDAGYYVHLDRLEPGPHSVRFHGVLPNSITVDVTYPLTVGRP